jgi:hypothetical protein
VLATLFAVKKIDPIIVRLGPSGHLVLAMVAVTGTLAIAHVIEIALWAFAMEMVGGVNPGDGLYFAFTSYTTLGYGDVLGTPGWRLLGPFSAMNGILLFGWSTALIVQVLGRVLPKP